MKPLRVRADFNGLFGDFLCLSHEDTCLSEDGVIIELSEGLVLTAFDEDAAEHGDRDDLLASGIVQRSPEWLRKHGSKWVLAVDAHGVRHESEIRAGETAENT